MPEAVFKLLIGICMVVRGMSVIVAHDCARHGCSQLGDLATHTAKRWWCVEISSFPKLWIRLWIASLQWSSKCLSSVRGVISTCVFPHWLRAHPSLEEGYCSVIRLLARCRGYRQDELTVQPLATKKKPQERCMWHAARRCSFLNTLTHVHTHAYIVGHIQKDRRTNRDTQTCTHAQCRERRLLGRGEGGWF